MNRAITKKLSLFLFLSALLPLKMASQTPSGSISQGTNEGQFTLKTQTEIVLVNVTVRDKSGMFVKDLKAEDFTVLEDGKKQTIISIDAENTDSVVTAETLKTPVLRNLTLGPANPPPATAPAVPLSENDLKDRRLIVLFFDLGSMQPQEVARAANSARDYINKQKSPADTVSIVTLLNSPK